MICREGFELGAVLAMRRVMHQEWDPEFIGRCYNGKFYGLYALEPVGGILIEGCFIHVASEKPCGFAVRRVVAEALKTLPFLVAPIAEDNVRALKLAKGLGFREELHSGGWRLLRRFAE